MYCPQHVRRGNLVERPAIVSSKSTLNTLMACQPCRAMKSRLRRPRPRDIANGTLRPMKARQTDVAFYTLINQVMPYFSIPRRQ